MVVQLAALALFSRLMAGHYLYASAAAVELAVLHNFVWHVRYTWRDRRDDSALLSRLLRFHLSNGLVSIVGSLVLMRVLVHGCHVPLLISNGIAILCCSAVNFSLGNNWAFAARGDVVQNLQKRKLPSARCDGLVFQTAKPADGRGYNLETPLECEDLSRR
jgi:putative flippase GtrA